MRLAKIESTGHNSVIGSVVHNLSAPVAQLDSASVFGTEGYWFESSRVYSFQSANQGDHAGSFRVPKLAASLSPRKTHVFCRVSAIERVSAISISPARLSPQNPKLANLRRDYRALAFWPRSKFIRRLLRLMRAGRRKTWFGLTAADAT